MIHIHAKWKRNRPTPPIKCFSLLYNMLIETFVINPFCKIKSGDNCYFVLTASNNSNTVPKIFFRWWNHFNLWKHANNVTYRTGFNKLFCETCNHLSGCARTCSSRNVLILWSTVMWKQWVGVYPYCPLTCQVVCPFLMKSDALSLIS